jgi:transcriptional regulator with XRE-family HTH domain
MGGTNIGLEIRKLRESKGISQEELADMAGLSRPSIVNIEGGKRKVSAGELISVPPRGWVKPLAFRRSL